MHRDRFQRQADADAVAGLILMILLGTAGMVLVTACMFGSALPGLFFAILALPHN